MFDRSTRTNSGSGGAGCGYSWAILQGSIATEAYVMVSITVLLLPEPTIRPGGQFSIFSQDGFYPHNDIQTGDVLLSVERLAESGLIKMAPDQAASPDS